MFIDGCFIETTKIFLVFVKMNYKINVQLIDTGFFK